MRVVPPDDPYERAHELAAAVATRLAADGWTVSGRPSTPPRFQFKLAHPLTATSTLSVDPTSDSMEGLIEEILGRPEFGVIATTPPEVPHASLIRAIRENARGYNWPISVVQRLALILRGHHLLTPDEADWLMQAGPCWPDADELAAAELG